MMATDIGSVRFSVADLDAAIFEANILTGLAQPVQRAMAARCMVAISLAIAIHDEEQYRVALGALGDLPDDEAERSFLREFCITMVEDLSDDLEDDVPALRVVAARLSDLVRPLEEALH